MKNKTLNGSISISCPQGGDSDYISIQLEDISSSTRFCEVRIKYAEFTQALTGRGYMPMAFELRASKVGLIREHKRELVEFRYKNWDKREEEAAQALIPFEVDGWKGSISDMLNYCHRNVNKDGIDYQEVTFTRYVEEGEVT
jgi:hypothetical protein